MDEWSVIFTSVMYVMVSSVQPTPRLPESEESVTPVLTTAQLLKRLKIRHCSPIAAVPEKQITAPRVFSRRAACSPLAARETRMIHRPAGIQPQPQVEGKSTRTRSNKKT